MLKTETSSAILAGPRSWLFDQIASSISQPNVIDGVNLFHRTDTLIYKCHAYKIPLTDSDVGALSVHAQILQVGRVVSEDESRQLSTLASDKQADSLELTGV